MSFIEILDTLLFTALLSYALLHMKFFERFPLSRAFIVIIFLVKIIAGSAYGIIYTKYYNGGDTMEYFNASKLITNLLYQHEYAVYLRMVFGYHSHPPPPDLQPYAFNVGYWNDASAYFIIRFHALSSLLSFDNYYVHVVFYEWLTLIGELYLLLFFYELIGAKKLLITLAVFFFPSMLFWSSGIHKDGISLAALGLVLYFSNKIFVFKKRPHKQNSTAEYFGKGKLAWRILGLLIGVWILLIVRNFWLLLLIPTLISLVWVINFPKHKLAKFIILHAIYFGVAINLNSFAPEWDFLNLIVLKQSEFQHISGAAHTESITGIIPSLGSVLYALPAAFRNCFLRPWFSEIENAGQLFAAVENILVILMFIGSLIFMKRKFSNSEQAIILFSLFFAFSLFAVIGITVPVVGALVRYKITGVMLLLVACITIINPEKLPSTDF